ncbi:hypothetical protein [Bartonella bovis]|uniref:hypothetical protein n=1 Tax=Bartonella bovis TaxID=155194 RepID=UPI001FCB3F88|nr:hypothetical protein [Bartonella bovis]
MMCFFLSVKRTALLGILIGGLVLASCEREARIGENYIPNDLDDALDMFDVGPQNLDDLPDEVLEQFDTNRRDLCQTLKQQRKQYYGYDKYENLNCNQYN